MGPRNDVTALLERVGAGDARAYDELVPLVYAELKSIAGRVVAAHPRQRTLPPTALVNEAYVKLVDRPDAPRWSGRRHFFAVAARVMRDVLVDHLRARSAAKRGGGRERVTLDGVAALFEARQLDVLALDEALDRLAANDAQLARIVELRYFGGLTIAETAEAIGVSTPTIERGWRVARAWLAAELAPGETGSPGPS